MKKKTKTLLACAAGCAAAGCAAYVIYKNKDEIIDLAEGILTRLKNEESPEDDFDDDFDDFDDFDDDTSSSAPEGVEETSAEEKADDSPEEEQFVSWDDIVNEPVETVPVQAEAVPEETEPAPAETKPVPADAEPAPAETEPVPAETEPAPADAE